MAELPWKIDTSITVEQLQKMVGVEDKPVVVEVEKGHIKRFVEAVGDSNPLWQDPVYAKDSTADSRIDIVLKLLCHLKPSQ